MARSALSPAKFVQALIRTEPLAYTGTALAWIVWNIWPLVPGILAKWFFDALSGHAPFGLTVPAVVALLFASGIARAGMMRAASHTGVPMRFRMRSSMQVNIIARILDLPGARALTHSVGEAISTLRDDAEAGALAADWPYDALAGCLFASGGLAILLSVNARLTALVFLPLTLLLVLANLARSRLIHARERSRQATANVAGAVGEIFHALQAIQAAGAEEQLVAHLRNLGGDRQRAMVRDVVQGALFDAAFHYTMNLGAGLVLLLAASAMRDGTFTVGDFALFAAYLMQVADFMGFVGYLIGSYQQSSVSFGRMTELLQGAPPETLVRPAPLVQVQDRAAMQQEREDPLDLLTVRGLTHIAPGGRGIMQASFNLRRGTLTVVTGGLGSGKTTLLRSLLGLLPASGEILWNGRLVEDPGDFMRPPRVAYVPQVPALLSGTLAQTIRMGLDVEERALTRAADSAVLQDDIAMMEQGWETQIGTGGMRLSGGQVQRVATARALLRLPDLLLLDDVSSALDQETERRLFAKVLRPGGTYLVVTSSAFLLRQADSVIWLEDGCIVAAGSLDFLKQHGLPCR
ncbi:MAG: ABC transporter ATP-binding protein [Thermaerobacter sp.]|nr:ABC transporter ATP-binding protein [Thermaerobacter sp.]